MKFTKMHGIGNDYVYVNAFDQTPPADPARLAIAISDRHFGVGGDGLILICPSERADARMRMFNADGSEAEMCGNGVRCVAKYIYDHGIARKDRVTIETGRGVLTLDLEVEGGKVRRVRVDMGAPILAGGPTSRPRCPATRRSTSRSRSTGQRARGDRRLDGQPARRGLRRRRRARSRSRRSGRCSSTTPPFPRRVNVHFVEVLGPARSGCGPGSAARGSPWPAAPAPARSAWPGCSPAGPSATILAHLPGGDLELEWPDDRSSGLHDRPGHRGLLGRVERNEPAGRTRRLPSVIRLAASRRSELT